MSGLNKLSVEYLSECFRYDTGTGRLVWLTRPMHHFKGGAGWHNFNNQFAGKLAGVRKEKNGRLDVKLDGRNYKAAHIVWRLHGNFLGVALDHINGDPSDDRISNLRVATAAENARNRKHASANSSGVRGVTWHSQSRKWWARVMKDGVSHSFGLHSTVDEAARVVRTAKKALFGEFARA